MAKAIINKHIASGVPTSDMFVEGELSKGEIIICNDPENPTLYILDSNNVVKKVSGETYDDTEVRGMIQTNTSEITSNTASIQELSATTNDNTIAIQELKENSVGNEDCVKTVITKDKDGTVIKTYTPINNVIDISEILNEVELNGGEY